MEGYQKAFIDFLLESGALTFGDFKLKSGRTAPYFVNTGLFDSGSKITTLGRFYAQHIQAVGLGELDVVFGPAYKGIPLCVATSSAMMSLYNRDIRFAFNRKEAKDHGDAGNIVGRQIKDGDRLVLVEDVVTAGTTLSEVIPFLRKLCRVDIQGVVIAVDRCEKGSGSVSAVKEISDNLGITVSPIVTIHQIFSYMKENELLNPEIIKAVREYIDIYGA